MIYKSHRKSANGVINIDPVVFCRYGAEAAVNCPGVAALSEKHEDSRGQVPGVDAFLNEDGHIVMDIRIIMAYGSNIKDTSEYLISRVSAYLESVTGFKTDRINIYVDDVKFVYQEGIGFNAGQGGKKDMFGSHLASEPYDDYVEYKGYRVYDETEDIWDDISVSSYNSFKEYPDEYIFEDDADVVWEQQEAPVSATDDLITSVMTNADGDILDSSGYIDLEKDEYRPLSTCDRALITSDIDWESFENTGSEADNSPVIYLDDRMALAPTADQNAVEAQNFYEELNTSEAQTSYDDIEEFFEAPDSPTPKMEETVSDLDVYERLIRNEDLKYGYGRGFVYPRYEFRSF